MGRVWDMISKISVYIAGTATSATMVAGVIAIVVSVVAPVTTDAQTVIIGNYKGPSVIVDHSVLENNRNTSDLNQRLKLTINSSGTPSDHQVRLQEKTIRLKGQRWDKTNSLNTEMRELSPQVKQALKAVSPLNNIPLRSGFKSTASRQMIKPRSDLQTRVQKTDIVSNNLDRPNTPIKAANTYLSPRQRFHIGFGAGSAILGGKEGAALDVIAASLKQRNSLRVQLLAYADGATGTLSQTRRLSLSRALAVRSHLMNKGIQSTRIDVRALGKKYKDGTPDRVDVIVTR